MESFNHPTTSGARKRQNSDLGPQSEVTEAAPYPLRRPKSTTKSNLPADSDPFPTPIQRVYSAGPQPSWDYTIPTRYFDYSNRDTAGARYGRRESDRDGAAVEEHEFAEAEREWREEKMKKRGPRAGKRDRRGQNALRDDADAEAPDSEDERGETFNCFGCFRGWRRRGAHSRKRD